MERRVLVPPLVRPRVVLLLLPPPPRPGSWEVGGDSEGRGGELVCLRVCWLFEGGLGTMVGGVPTDYGGGQAGAPAAVGAGAWRCEGHP